jgi:hypothetical protein
MALDLHQFLLSNNSMLNMPAIVIRPRESDKRLIYDKKKTRLDRMASDVYQDDLYWRLILWANPQYSLEFDIPDGTVIRVPFPKEEVEKEVVQQIINKRNK